MGSSDLTDEKFVDALHPISLGIRSRAVGCIDPGRQPGRQLLLELYLARDGAMMLALTDAYLNAIVPDLVPTASLGRSVSGIPGRKLFFLADA
ncbi:hypothetical protein CWO90_03290 [Bradyrhizobium sp. Leo121]|nr:hypothetical protein CWO90_03290 [Bradyrhizobium sp. Leo121]